MWGRQGWDWVCPQLGSGPQARLPELRVRTLVNLGSVLRLLCSSQHGLGPRLGCGPGPLPGDTGHTSSQGPGSALPAGAGDPPPASLQGGCATFLCQPLDVLKTRLMNSQGEYRVSVRPARPLGAAASAAGHLVTPPVSAGCHPLCHGDCQARAPRLLQGTSPGRVGRPVGRLGAEVALSGCGARAFQGSAACSPTASCARPCPGPGAL